MNSAAFLARLAIFSDEDIFESGLRPKFDVIIYPELSLNDSLWKTAFSKVQNKS
jgi:hypothetical protein